MDMLNLDEHGKRIEEEIVEVKEMVQNKTISTNKAIILQTIAVILTLVGIALAYERRITTVEVNQQAEYKIRQDADAVILHMIEGMQDREIATLQTQTRLATIVDGIEKRHSIEDSKRIR